jgi:hypothetical protein
MAAALYDQLLAAKLQSQKDKRKFNSIIDKLETVVARNESSMMELLDTDSNVPASRNAVHMRFSALTKAMGSSWLGSGPAPRLNGDAALHAWMSRSSVEPLLRQLRRASEKLSTQLHALVDESQRALKFIFSDATKSDGILSNPKTDFDKACESMLQKFETVAVQCFRDIDDTLMRTSQVTVRPTRVYREAGSQTLFNACRCESLEAALHEQKRKCSELQQRLKSLDEKVQSLTAASETTKQHVDTITSSVVRMGRSSTKALALFQKHRYNWSSTAVKDPFRHLEPDDSRSSAQVLVLVEACRTATTQLEQFGNWVLSDEQGGACFSRFARTVENDRENARTAQSLARMEAWSAKQEEIWKRRRSSLTTTPVNVRFDTSVREEPFTPRAPTLETVKSFQRRHSLC